MSGIPELLRQYLEVSSSIYKQLGFDEAWSFEIEDHLDCYWFVEGEDLFRCRYPFTEALISSGDFYSDDAWVEPHRKDGWAGVIVNNHYGKYLVVLDETKECKDRAIRDLV